jgi:hypothetical protein
MPVEVEPPRQQSRLGTLIAVLLGWCAGGLVVAALVPWAGVLMGVLGVGASVAYVLSRDRGRLDRSLGISLPLWQALLIAIPFSAWCILVVISFGIWHAFREPTTSATASEDPPQPEPMPQRTDPASQRTSPAPPQKVADEPAHFDLCRLTTSPPATDPPAWLGLDSEHQALVFSPPLADARIPVPSRIKNGRFDSVDRVTGVIAGDHAGVMIVNERIAWFALVPTKKPKLRHLTQLPVNEHSGLTGYVQPRVAFTAGRFLVTTQRAGDLLISVFDDRGNYIGKSKRVPGSAYVDAEVVATDNAFFVLAGTPGDWGPHNLQLLELSTDGELRSRHRLTRQPQGTTENQRAYRVSSALMLRDGVVWARAATSLGSHKDPDPYEVVLWWDGQTAGETRCP